jgi:ribonuclease J
MQQLFLNSNITIDLTANQKPKNPPSNSSNNRRRKISPSNWTTHTLNQSISTNILPSSITILPWEQPVKIGSLLWLEQVWQCIFIEYKDDIILVDAWLEFCAGEMMWADYIIPDISYIKQHRKKLKGIVITHGHLDHIGALRDILPALDFPMIYTTPLTLGIIKKSFEDQKLIPKIKYTIVDPDMDIVKLWCFTIEFVRVNHNIPETLAMAIQTPKWLIFNSADFKIDHTPAIDKPADLGKIARIGNEWVKLYIWDSLWSNKKWRSLSEKVIGENLETIIKQAEGRLIIATFASNVGRIIQIIQSAMKYDKVVFLSGRSMINNVEICQHLNYIQNLKGRIRKLDKDIENMPDQRVIVLATGAQWEEFSALARIGRGEHPDIQLHKGDTVLVSSSTIPGNELDMAKMLNGLIVQNIKLITKDDMDVHASWHGFEEDHKLMLTLLRPAYFMPYYTDAVMRYAHKKLWIEMGIAEENILMPVHNGAIIEMYDNGVRLSDKSLKLDTILIDGKWIWHLSGEYVMKARNIMGHNGIVALIFKINSLTKEIVGNVQIESRWFVYSSEVKKIHTYIINFVNTEYNKRLKRIKDVKTILKWIKEDLTWYIEKILDRAPLIVPMFVYINQDVPDDDQSHQLIGLTLEEQWYEKEDSDEKILLPNTIWSTNSSTIIKQNSPKIVTHELVSWDQEKWDKTNTDTDQGWFSNIHFTL